MPSRSCRTEVLEKSEFEREQRRGMKNKKSEQFSILFLEAIAAYLPKQLLCRSVYSLGEHVVQKDPLFSGRKSAMIEPKKESLRF